MTTYTITSFDKTFTIGEEIIDTSNTSLTLSGRHASGWGQAYAQNFVDLLESFAGAGAPSNPMTGQLWYDTATGLLNVYANGQWGKVAAKADALTTARTISLAGDAIGSASFDGSQNVTIQVTLPTLLNNPGAFTSPAFTVDAFGRIISISNNGVSSEGPPSFVESFNGRSQIVTLNSTDVINALGYTPYSAANPNGWGPPTPPPNLSGLLPLSGGVMTGSINFNGNKSINMGAPVNAADAVRLADLQGVSNNKTTRVFNGGISTSYNVTVSPNAPAGGNDGDVWYRY